MPGKRWAFSCKGKRSIGKKNPHQINDEDF